MGVCVMGSAVAWSQSLAPGVTRCWKSPMMLTAAMWLTSPPGVLAGIDSIVGNEEPDALLS